MAKKTDKEHEKPMQDDEMVEGFAAEDSERVDASEPEESESSRESESDANQGGRMPRKPWYKRFWHWLLAHKKVSIPLAIILMLGVLAAIPYTRYLLAGTVIRQSFSVSVVDAETGKPVSSATVRLAGKQATTDNQGRAVIKTNAGYAKLEVSKKYYEKASQNTLIPLKKQANPHQVKLKAIGRAVPVTVLNKISQKPAGNITIKATNEETEAKTEGDGKATLVVPADKQEIKISLSGGGFNTFEAILKVTGDEDPANTFQLTPSGKIYFLSNASGKIDLIKSNLDGTDRAVVLPGTGKEDRYNTVLLASRDWTYIALLSKRDGGEYAKLFLIETANGDKMTVMDEGEATFNVYGWSGDRFIYKVNRAKVKSWESKGEALKSYSASAKKITTLAETAAEGDQYNNAYEDIANRVYILGEEIAFIKNWIGSNCNYCSWVGQNNQATFNTVRADASQKKVVKTYNDQYVESRTAEFGEVYILFREGDKSKVDEYHDGKLEGIDQTEAEFYREEYPYYSVSPSSNKTFWSDYRDGKNNLFVGDGNGGNGKEIGRADEYTVYGWFTDDYILLTKKGSEMLIMPAGGLEGGVEKALKISDYYKPNYSANGFGYGYGG